MPIGLSTVHDYLERAVAAGIGWPLPEGLSQEELESKLFGNQAVVARAVPTPPQPDWKAIHEQLQQHRHLTLQLLWQEYRQAHPEGYRYSWFCERYQQWRRHLDVPERPQRQSQVLSVPAHMEFFLNGEQKHPHVVTWTMIEQILLTNPIETDVPIGEQKPRASGEKKQDKQRANQDWLENYGVPDLIDFWAPHIADETEPYDKADGEHHPIKPCPCHKDEDFHEHSHEKDCEIIVFNDGGIGISCFSGDLGLKQVIKKMNEIKGEKYPHLIFEEPDPVDEALDFGAVGAQEGVEGPEEQPAGTESWSQIADELDEVRRGKGRFRNKAGNIEQKALPRHIAEERILQFVKGRLREARKGAVLL